MRNGSIRARTQKALEMFYRSQLKQDSTALCGCGWTDVVGPHTIGMCRAIARAKTMEGSLKSAVKAGMELVLKYRGTERL